MTNGVAYPTNVRDYLRYWFHTPSAQPRDFSTWLADGAWAPEKNVIRGNEFVAVAAPFKNDAGALVAGNSDFAATSDLPVWFQGM